MKKKDQLTVLRENHFDNLRKSNAVTDAKNGMLSLGAMKTMDIILREYQQREQEKITLELSFLRKKLALNLNNDYVDRIKMYLMELKLPFELRDYTDKNSGKKVAWQLTSFLGDVVSYKDSQHLVDITISSGFIDFMVEKAGYTQINLGIVRQFKTKFGYKIYEMYRRYYGLPNTTDSKIGVINKSLDEMNEKFGTSYLHASKLIPGITRGIEEIKAVTDEQIYFMYDKAAKQFVFSWAREGENDLKKKCIVPPDRIDELSDWIIKHYPKKVSDITKLKKRVRVGIIKNNWDDLEGLYRGMLSYRYGYSDDEIDGMKMKSGKYRDFDKKEEDTIF